MEIRPARTEEDLCGKAFVHYNAWNEAYSGLVDQAFLDSRTYEQSLESAHRAFDNGYTTYVAGEGGKIIGFADFGDYRDEDLADAGEIYAIYVLKEHYGRGAGYALLQKAMSLMPDKKRFAVWTLPGNERAMRFYERNGFIPDGTEMTYTLGKEVTLIRLVKENNR